VPNSPVAVLALAELLARQERPEEAFEQYRHAADLDARNPLALLRAAELAVRLHREVLAAGFLDRLLQQHATYAPALALYGDIMKARGDRNRARDHYQRALRGGEGQIDRARVQASLRQLGPGVAPRPRPPAPRR